MQSALWQTLDQFLAGLPRPILQVTDDSRQVTAGSLFVAVTGGTFDGHHFIAQAIERGAVAVVG
jgi:UDP-N-acetylmuramoyl-L-alanyl-D-glutamate--2,6-diaminopimelate ligase